MKIGATYNVAGKFFSSKIERAIEEQKKKDKKKSTDEKPQKTKNKKPFECLTDSKMLYYLSSNVKDLAEQNGIEEHVLAKHIEQFKKFWGYLDGYNTNRENYYSTKEQSTAVATRIVHENLPTFCDNILRFEKRRECYLGIYKYLKDNNCVTKIKNTQGEEIEAEAIAETVFRIEHFNDCLAQPQIEEYNGSPA